MADNDDTFRFPWEEDDDPPPPATPRRPSLPEEPYAPPARSRSNYQAPRPPAPRVPGQQVPGQQVPGQPSAPPPPPQATGWPPPADPARPSDGAAPNPASGAAGALGAVPGTAQPQQQPPAVAPPAYPYDWGEPTQAIPRTEPPVSQSPPTQPPISQPPLTQPPAMPAAETPAPDSDPDPLADLFATSAFQTYDDRLLAGIAEGPVPGAAGMATPAGAPNPLTASPAGPAGPGSARGGLSPKTIRTIIWVGVGLVTVLTMIALFAVGTRIGSLSTAEAPTTTTLPETGPLPPGNYTYDQLNGGECVDPFDDAWQAQYTVVPCDGEHGGQLALVASLDSAELPGDDAAKLARRACRPVEDALDYSVAGQYDDVRVAMSYSTTEQQWDAGLHDVYCFVTRTSGQPITGTLLPAAEAADPE